MSTLSLLLGAAATLATQVSDPFLLDGRATPDHVLESREKVIMDALYTSNNKNYYAAGNNNNGDMNNNNNNNHNNGESMEEWYDRQYWSVKLVYSHESCGEQYLVGVRNELVGENEENCIKQLGQDLEYAPDEDGSGSYAYTECGEVNEKNNYDVYEVRECRKGITRTPAGVKAVRADLYYQECEDDNLRVVIYVAEGCNGVGFDNSGQYHDFQCGPSEEFQVAMDNNDNMNQNKEEEEIDFVLTTCGHESCTDVDNYQGNNNNNNDNMNNNNNKNGECKSTTYKTGECYYEGDVGGYKHKIYSCWDETDEDWRLEAASIIVPVEESSSAGVIAATTITAVAALAIGGFFLYKRNKAAQDGHEALLGPNENINSGQARSNV